MPVSSRLTPSPPNTIVCTSVPLSPRPVTSLGSPPESSETGPYARGPSSAHTRSEYCTSAVFGPDMNEDTTVGSIPSATDPAQYSSGLPAASVALPSAGLYESVIASGPVLGRFASSTSTSVSGRPSAFCTVATALPAASAPDTDHPAAAAAAVSAPGSTASSNSTCMALSETAVAPLTDGSCLSLSACWTVMPSSSLSSPDVTAAPSMVTLPVALDRAPAGENVIVCVREPSSPSRSVMLLDCPSTMSDVYAPCCAAAGLVYVMTAVLLPVIPVDALITVSVRPS